MAELMVRRPGEPDRVFPLPDRPVTVGRGAECDLQLLEVRASRKHLRIAPHESAIVLGLDGTPRKAFVATDLESSNGTYVGVPAGGSGTPAAEDRILRRGLVHGDVLRIGETTLTFHDTAPAATAAAPSAAPLVVGTSLVVEALPSGAAATPPPAAPAAGDAADAVSEVAVERPEAARDSDADGEEADTADTVRRARRKAQRALLRGGAILVVGIAVLVGEHFVVGGVADRRKAEAMEAAAYTSLVAEADLGFKTLQGDFEKFQQNYPYSRHLPELTAYVERRRVEEVERNQAEAEFEAIQLGLGSLSEFDSRARLSGLKRSRPGDERLVRWVDFALAELDRRRDEIATRDWVAAAADADRALRRGDAAAALRRVSAFRALHPDGVLARETRDKVAAKLVEVRDGARKLADAAIDRAAALPDHDERRAALGVALKGLAGTAEEDRLRAAIRGAASLAATGGTPAAPGAPGTPATPGAAPGATPATPPPLTLAPELLARTSEAERLSRERNWGGAQEAYTSLLAANAPPRLKQEWGDRSEELRRILSLVKDLSDAVAAAPDKAVRARLNGSPVEVVGADASGVRLRRKDGEDTQPWGALAPPDLLALLSRPRPTPDQRLAAAILAADVGERKACVEHLVALVDVESHRALAFQAAARRLYGRAAPPEGGYLVLDGDLIDRPEHARRLEARRVAALKVEAVAVAAKIAGDPTFKKLENLREKRAELDKRRAYALLAIFNEKHYPYPYRPPEAPSAVQSAYPIVQAEIDRRIALVEEVWNDPLTVNVAKGREAVKHVARHAEVLRELESKGQDVSELRKAVQPYAMYADAGPLTVQTFFLDAEERALLRYNRWVMETYNATPTLGPKDPQPFVSEPEREQTRITNAYRVMMGFTFRVEPGAASLEAIEAATVAGILDQSKETSRTPLRAVRIDERLVKSARFHSIDMEKHGYFAHLAPANSDMPGSTPFDRMAKQGYSGGGASENIAGGQSSPLGAHMAWRHSSGHHRNILSDWADMGAGQAGNKWTQNFGGIAGGPMPPEPKTPTTPEEPSGDK